MLKRLYARLVLWLIRPALSLQVDKLNSANDLAGFVRRQAETRLYRAAKPWAE